MSILGELGGLVSPALTVGTQAAGAYQGAKAHENESQKSDVLQLLALLRQKQQLDTDTSYKGAEMNEANARAKWYGETPLKPFANADGSVVALPTRTGPGGAVPTVAPLPGVKAPPPAPKTVATPKGYVNVGRDNTGTPVLGPDGQPVMPVPRAAGANGNMAIVHTLTAVKAQIDETNRQLVAANLAAKSLNDPAQAEFLSPAAKAQGQAAQSRIPQLQQRLDSLTAVHDNLASRQQAAGGTPPPAYTPPKRSAPRDITADSTKAAADLNTVLQSDQPDAVKNRARQLFRQQIVNLRAAPAAPAATGTPDPTDPTAQEDDE